MIYKLDINEYHVAEYFIKKLNPNFKLEFIQAYESIFVYKESNKILGLIHISNIYEVMDILNIIVDDEYQNKGVGSKLIDYVILVNKPEKILLEVNIKNIQAINFYKKNSFRIIRTIKAYYGVNDAYSMERVINR